MILFSDSLRSLKRVFASNTIRAGLSHAIISVIVSLRLRGTQSLVSPISAVTGILTAGRVCSIFCPLAFSVMVYISVV